MSEHYYESSFDLMNLLKGSPESPCVHRARFDKTAVQNNCTADEKTEARRVQVASSGVQSEQLNEVGFSLGGSAEALLFNSTLINRASFPAVTVFYQCPLSSLPLPLSAAFLPQLSQCQPLLVVLYHVGGSFTAFFAVTFSCNYILKLKYPQVSSFLMSLPSLNSLQAVSMGLPSLH